MEQENIENLQETNVETEVCQENEMSELEKLKLENAELNDKYVRLYADKENMQRRLANEVANISKYKDESLAKDIFPVMDDIERCIIAMKKQEQDVEGIALIYNKMLSVLKQHNIEQIIPNVGDDFNVDIMEAIASIPNEENVGKVVDCTQSGYKFPERVIRYAKVVVGQ